MTRIAVLAATLIFLAACVSTPLKQIPPGLPSAPSTVTKDAANGGRVQSIAVDPTNVRHAVIAMQFGGLWRTFNGGDAWFRTYSLPQVYVTDVEFGGDGKTVVASVFRDNHVTTGGGIYVSHDGGDNWKRPPSGIVPTCAPPWTGGGDNTEVLTRTASAIVPLCDAVRTPIRTSAYSVSHAPDAPGLWYVGTDFGIAVSADNGATWTHHRIDPSVPLAADRQQDAAQSVLPFPGGIVLALTRTGLYRSDDRGDHWRLIIADNFSNFAPSGGSVGSSGNKMDRAPNAPWAFIFKKFEHNSQDPRGGSGQLWFYELANGMTTLLPLPQGFSRGPFVRVSNEPAQGPQGISVWVGEGWDGYYVTRNDAAAIRAIRSDAQWDDWVSFIAPAGIHADLGDMGLDDTGDRAYVGSDGGIYKRDANEALRWVSAAAPGSGMNSLQISALAGTNFVDGNGHISTTLYFSTQDNRHWSSPDGGNSWPANDANGAEGNTLQVRGDALLGEPLTIGFVDIGPDPATRFADALFQHSRGVPSLDENGQSLVTDPQTALSAAYYLEGSKATADWLRVRVPSNHFPAAEIFVSQNNGENWRKRFDVDYSWKGAFARTNLGGDLVIVARSTSAVGVGGEGPFDQGIMAWMPVETGPSANTGEGTFTTIGLARLSDLYANRVDAIGTNQVVRLPNNGSLGTRFTEFDVHAIFGADPFDERFLIAPDIVNNVVTVSADAGLTWSSDFALTNEVLRGGELKLWGGKPDLMEVTEIAFDPYQRGRILVGTREAGIICSANQGKSWRTVFDSPEIQYITGFHFRPDGGVFISSYGHGLWYLAATTGCPKAEDFPWDRHPVVPPVVENGGVLERAMVAPAPGANAEIFVASSGLAGGTTILGDDNALVISGRGFGAGENLLLTLREGAFVKQSVRADAKGRFVTRLRVPETLPYGSFTVEATRADKAAPVVSVSFSKGYGESADEEAPRE